MLSISCYITSHIYNFFFIKGQVNRCLKCKGLENTFRKVLEKKKMIFLTTFLYFSLKLH